MRRTVWSTEAREEYAEILRYAMERDPPYASLLEVRILAAVDLLAERPIGRPSRLPEVSQKLVLKTPYIIAYRVDDGALLILRVVHQSRDWPEGSWPSA